MNPSEIIGFIAGTLVSLSVLPQVLKSWKTKSTKDIALSWSVINLVGQAFWIGYGVIIGSSSLVIMSGITFTMNVSMIFLKVRYG